MSKTENLAVFASPGRYVQGRNATAKLGEQMKLCGLEGPVVILADTVSVQAGQPGRMANTWPCACPTARLWHIHVREGGHPAAGERVGRGTASGGLCLQRGQVWWGVHGRGD